MRLMTGLPDVGENLAPDTLVAGLVRRHHAARRRQDCCSHAALHARQLIGGRVLAPAGLGHERRPLITGWRASVYLSLIRSALNSVVLLRSREPGGRVSARCRSLDIALLAQDSRQLLIEPRGGHDHVLAVRAERVAYTGQAVCYRVTHISRASPFLKSRASRLRRSLYQHHCHWPCGHQDDFVMPGIMPSWAISRRQIRHRPNLR